MKQIISIVCLLAVVFFECIGQARTVEFDFVNYEGASKATSFLRFDMSSTKLGLITTSFQGFVKKFAVKGDVKGEKIVSGATVEFAVRDLDTDIDGRNEKLWNQCLDQEHHGQIKLALEGEIPIDGVDVDLPGQIYLRGYSKPIVVKIRATRRGNNLEVVLSTKLSIKELNIPDPSIVVASVKDEIAVFGQMSFEIAGQ